MKNLGPKSTEWLQDIGVHTVKDIEELGVVMTYKILKHRFPGVNRVMLYALYGALHDIHWNSITPEVKEELNRAADEDDLEIGC